MPDQLQTELLQYYQDELRYLREAGEEFAERYPKVASRLELGPEGSADPHVERLLEAFAFLTARIRLNLDQQFPEITSALLDILYPQYLAPVPSASVAKFTVDPTQGKITTGHEIPRHSPLFAETAEGITARFQTSYPVTLWPLEVDEARVEGIDRYDFLDGRTDVASLIRVRLTCMETSLQELEMDSLRFYLNTDLRTGSTLHELLFAHGRGVILLPEQGKRHALPTSALRQVGFGSDEGLYPFPSHSRTGYQVIQEYFTFPRKFLFFDLHGLEGKLAGEYVDLLILLGRTPERSVSVDENTFALGCTPIVNLFPKTTEPIRLDHRSFNYRLIPDIRRERSTEIHSILSVSRSAEASRQTEILSPYYAFGHDEDRSAKQAFWFARRIPSTRRDIPGTEMLLSFVDLDFNPRQPDVQTVYAHTLCTNRRLAEQLPIRARLTLDSSGPIQRIEALHRPSAQQDPPGIGESRWRLISQLSLNHLSLSDDPQALRSLREILALHANAAEPAVQRQIAGIRDMQTQSTVARVGTDAWRGFVQGTEITLTFDEEAFAGTNAFLFATVLRHFFGLQATVNSFTQLVARTTRNQEEWMRWAPLAGEHPIL
jgi:type VI secretion system protein ImpG